jgi:hypothetical protein
MDTLEYRTVDKSTWGDGAWQSEPDKKQWLDEGTGYPCLIVRGPSGALCGYVGVPRGHPHYGKHYDHEDISVEVHGGLTFSDLCAEAPTREAWERFKERGRRAQAEAKRYPYGDSARFLRERILELENYGAFVTWHEAAKICHRVEAGEDDAVWWFGFDCAHAWDLTPGYRALSRHFRSDDDDVYRDQGYVEDECRKLARQLKEAAPPLTDKD